MIINEKPLVTYVLLAYNQEEFIRQAFESALAQNYSPLEIIVSDDCSHDRTFEIIREIASNYNGPKSLQIFRNEQNLGIGAHIQKIVEVARGSILIMAAGDDFSQPSRTEKTVEAFQKNDEAYGFISGFNYVDEHSEKTGLVWLPNKKSINSLEAMSRGEIHCPGASCAWSARLFHGWTPLIGVTHEDRVLPFRVLLSGGKIECSDELLVSYRSIGGISRNSRDDLLINPKKARSKELIRILPDAKIRLLDFEKKYSAESKKDILRILLAKEVSKLEMEISALGSAGIFMDFGYVKLLFGRALTMPSLRAYLKVRFHLIYLFFRKFISKW